jgi:pimeloyl-ACP methyl ester carboxylesterase
MIEGESSVFRHAAAESERRMQVFQAAERATLPGAGHMMQRHQPAALAELLTAFLAREH